MRRRRASGASRSSGGSREHGECQRQGAGEKPRVLILGGGFAGVGAAQKLEDADAEVVLVDRHDYHTFQPLLYQLASGLLETTAVGHSLRDLVERQKNATVHKATRDRGRPRRAGGPASTGSRRSATTTSSSALGAEVNFFGTEGAAEHAFPMYTLPHAVRLKDHLLERWEAADRDPSLVEDGALNVVVVGGGPTGSRDRRRARRALPRRTSPATTRTSRRSKRA